MLLLTEDEVHRGKRVFIIYLKSSELYKVAHTTRGVLRLKECMYTKFIYKKSQGIKET